MTPSDKPAFVAALSRTFRTLRQPLPDAEVLEVYWRKLEQFPLQAVLEALSRCLDESRYAPTPAEILLHLPKRSDDRPEAGEAWAIALPALDEHESVVWTSEIAEAWAACKSAFGPHGRNEFAARQAFKDAYTRLVDVARRAGTPVRWIVSRGFDADRLGAAVDQAVRNGRLQLADARAIVPALQSHSGDCEVSARRDEAIAVMKAALSGKSAIERAADTRSRAAAETRQAEQARKADIACQVAAYQRSPGEGSQ